jgi:hypothetical protein
MSATMAVSARPTLVDLELYQGDDFAVQLTVTNADNTPANLSGALARAQIRSAAPSADVAAAFSGSISANVVTLSLAHAASALLSGNYVWDCHLTYPGGTVATIAAGRVRVSAEVTR